MYASQQNPQSSRLGVEGMTAISLFAGMEHSNHHPVDLIQMPYHVQQGSLA